MEIHAELDDLNGLLDVHGKGSAAVDDTVIVDERHTLGAESVIVVFELDRPIGRQRPFDAGAHGPAEAVFRCCSIIRAKDVGHGVIIARPGDTAFDVGQPVAVCVADARGAAWASDNYTVADVLGLYNATASEDRFGWTVGAGIEWALSNDWSVKLEYDYYGFGTQSVTFTDGVSGATGPVDIKQNIQVITLGLNFHIWAGGAP